MLKQSLSNHFPAGCVALFHSQRLVFTQIHCSERLVSLIKEKNASYGIFSTRKYLESSTKIQITLKDFIEFIQFLKLKKI